jgi:hypothetical protein
MWAVDSDQRVHGEVFVLTTADPTSISDAAGATTGRVDALLALPSIDADFVPVTERYEGTVGPQGGEIAFAVDGIGMLTESIRLAPANSVLPAAVHEAYAHHEGTDSSRDWVAEVTLANPQAIISSGEVGGLTLTSHLATENADNAIAMGCANVAVTR